MKKKLSISDIAKSLNISVTTVSFILNGKAQEKRISEEVVQRVEKFIAEVGYKPDSLARSLRTGKSYTIGLLVEDISNPFFAGIARQIEDNAYKKGYKILYSSTDNDPQKTSQLIQMFRDRHVDGYIIAAPQGIAKDLNSLIDAGRPVVLFDRTVEGVVSDYVGIDNYKSTNEAVKMLIGQGFLKIGMITLKSEQSQMKDRLHGYVDAIKESKLTERLIEIPFTEDGEEIRKQVEHYLDTADLDAVLFATNYLAVNGLRVIYSRNIAIPKDLAVIAFDDHDVFELSNPSITAITQPVTDIASASITLLLDKLAGSGQSKEHRSEILQTTLKLRKSTAKEE